MAYTITKTTNGRFKIDNGTTIQYFPTANSIIYPNGNNIVAKYVDERERRIFNIPYTDVTAPEGAAIGDCTFDYTSGGVEDEWTKATHGLAVNDGVIFSAVGTGVTEYVISTQYYVITIPTASTFQLSATLGGDVIEDVADSVGTWTLQRYDAASKTLAIEAL